MITLKEIAKEAGVSVMTVSRVVNKQYSKVSAENIQRIQRLIDSYGYVPNYSARSLSARNSRIAVIIIRGDVDVVMRNPHNAEMVGCMCKHLQEGEYSPMLYSVSDYNDVYQRLRSWKADGAIFFGMFDHEISQIQEMNQIPLVFLDSYSKVRQMTNVGIDDYKGGQLAARHLLEKGHTRVALIHNGIEHEGVERQRYLGFTDTLEKAGHPLRPQWALEEGTYIECLPALFAGEEKATGIFSTADFNAMQIINELRGRGISVPGDCSVVGFDNLFFASCTQPRLTTVAQDIPLKAGTAVRLLLRHIANPGLPKEKVVLDVRLVERDSVAALPGP